MAGSFVNQVAELEHALSRVESSLKGGELERARALVAALLEVHKSALVDFSRALGQAELVRAAAAEPSVAWLLACHELYSEQLSRAVEEAELKQAKLEAKKSLDSSFVPVARLLRRAGEPAA